MAWPGEVLLEVDLIRAERRQRFLLGQRKRLWVLLLVLGDPHPLPTPTRRRLDDHWKPDLLRDLEPRVRVLDRPRRTGHRGHFELLRELPRRRLVPHLADLIARGAYERDIRRPHDVRELRVLGQEPVAGVNGIRPGDLGGRDNPRGVEVAVAGGRAADAYIVVGEPRVQAVAGGLRVDGDCRDAQLLAR